MVFTLKKDLNYKSLTLRHQIVTQAIVLLEGRETSLNTEKAIYTMLSLVHSIVNEDVINVCNNDERDLFTIIEQDIEPFFQQVVEEDEIQSLYTDCLEEIHNFSKKVYDEHHSMIGLIGTILDFMASLDNTDKKEVLVKTGEMAAKIKEQHDEKVRQSDQEYKEKIVNKQEEMNSHLLELIDQYKVKIDKNTEKEA